MEIHKDTEEMANALPESFVMKDGDGPSSYTQNSSYQKDGINITKDLIAEAIAAKLDINNFSTSNPFIIADFGCSTGPNTFVAVQNIVEAVQLKYKEQNSIMNSHIPEFHVYFNDHVSNDFNTLFESLPPDRQYFTAGVPGTFHGRLFPKASVHFAHSSYTIHWLSKVPNEVLDKSSLAWNKGRISYANAPEEVVEAYSAQFAKDMESFLHARAEELFPGGLLALLLFCISDEIPLSQTQIATYSDFMGSSLMDMAKMGRLSEEEVDSFNLPIYQTNKKELIGLIETNECFDIENMKPLIRLTPEPEALSLGSRAALDGILKKHFSSDIIEEVFNCFTIKATESSTLLREFEKHPCELFLVLKRKYID